MFCSPAESDRASRAGHRRRDEHALDFAGGITLLEIIEAVRSPIVEPPVSFETNQTQMMKAGAFAPAASARALAKILLLINP